VRRALGAIVVLLGCLGSGCQPETRFDVLRISKAFTAEEAREIALAVADWCAVSNATCVPLELESERPNVHRVDDPSAGFWGNIEWPPPEIWINVALSKSIFRTMGHEMGHSWVGDVHMKGSGYLLSLRWFNEDSLDCIDQETADFVCQKIGCGAWQPGTCQVTH
jgi:hypothetical protein